jgi:hypothetical protein
MRGAKVERLVEAFGTTTRELIRLLEWPPGVAQPPGGPRNRPAGRETARRAAKPPVVAPPPGGR